MVAEKPGARLWPQRGTGKPAPQQGAVDDDMAIARSVVSKHRVSLDRPGFCFIIAIMDAVKRAVAGISKTVGGMVDFALPPLCLCCHLPVATDGGLCGGCWSGLRLIEWPYCDVLGTPFAYDLGAGAISAEAMANPPEFDCARAAAVHTGVARTLVHRLKYADKGDLARWMAGWMVRGAGDVLERAELIVPVPLHRRRLWSRRYNQAAHLAHAVGRATGIAVASRCLERTKPTRQQVGLSAADRASNVRGAFRPAPGSGDAVKGRRILLLDDVLTTGSTVNACARALRRAGATGVDVLVFSRVVPGQEDAI